MKVSIITGTYNRADTIKDTLDSVVQQDYQDIEHIIIDGASTDNTLDIVAQYKRPGLVVKSEPDKGAFDALNKGLAIASGDIIGFLHSDDFFANNQIISAVVHCLQKYQVDAVFGDVVFVDPKDITKKKRYYSSKGFHPGKFSSGFMPAHPSFFTKKKFYDQFGHFNTKYKIAADLDLLIRFLHTHQLSYHYMNMLMVYMRAGGLSNASLRQRYILNRESITVCKANGIPMNALKILSKLFKKVPEFFFVEKNGTSTFDLSQTARTPANTHSQKSTDLEHLVAQKTSR